MTFGPLVSTGYSPQYNLDGLINVHGSNAYYSYAQVFRNGFIESIMVGARRDSTGRPILTVLVIERKVIAALVSYFGSLKALDVPLALIGLSTLEGFRSAILGVAESLRTSDDNALIR